jgi:DNA polymerase-3 subunit epsilon
VVRSSVVHSTLQNLPDTAGVYLFYGANDELLYVGKSKTIRTRVRSHCSTRAEARLMRRVQRVEVRETAGELGALLLESQLIKELQPLFNVAARRRRRLIIARRVENAGGYAGIVLEAVDRIEINDSSPLMAIFKHRTQAKEYLTSIARTYRLCPKLLRLDQSRTFCFWYHLGRCTGACMGEENCATYNARVEEAFAARRVKAWPYDGGVVFEERSNDGERRELFFVDNWCLIASYHVVNGKRQLHLRGSHRFDYDSYKILYDFLTDASNRQAITVLDRPRFESAWRHMEAVAFD